MSSHYESSHYGPSHYLSNHYGRELVIELPAVEVHPPGMGRQQIIREDEEIMTIIMAFLTMKGQ